MIYFEVLRIIYVVPCFFTEIYLGARFQGQARFTTNKLWKGTKVCGKGFILSNFLSEFSREALCLPVASLGTLPTDAVRTLLNCLFASRGRTWHGSDGAGLDLANHIVC